MLVLTRKANQGIIIGDGDQVELIVIEVKGNQVRLGIKAPKNIRILRKELTMPSKKNRKNFQQ